MNETRTCENDMLDLAEKMEQRLLKYREVKSGEVARALIMLLRHAAQAIDPEAALQGAIQRNRARVPREHGGEREP